jgi:short-subunit dehydrogenase
MSQPTLRPLAVITGASSGIGYELARKFADNGYDLAIVAENQDKLQAAAASLSALESQPDLEVIGADLATADGVRLLYRALKALGRPIDVLAANAGVGVSGNFANESSLDEELRLIHLNVTSQVHLIKLVVFDMVERGAGDVLITSSIAGLMPAPRMAVYAATKSFLRSFGQAIRNELQDTGVNVTVLMPGPTDTEFFERADMLDTKVGRGEKQDPAEVADAAFTALRQRDDHVVPGLKNKLQAGMARLLSDENRAKVHGNQIKQEY